MDWKGIRDYGEGRPQDRLFHGDDAITVRQVQELIDRHGDDIRALVRVEGMSEGINAQVDRELEIAQGSWGSYRLKRSA